MDGDSMKPIDINKLEAQLTFVGVAGVIYIPVIITEGLSLKKAFLVNMEQEVVKDDLAKMTDAIREAWKESGGNRPIRQTI
jgi:hypothetical protein